MYPRTWPCWRLEPSAISHWLGISSNPSPSPELGDPDQPPPALMHESSQYLLDQNSVCNMYVLSMTTTVPTSESKRTGDRHAT